MTTDPPTESGFKVLALDDVLYGPVAIPVLIEWAGDERILADSWIYCVRSGTWIRAGQIPELRRCFGEPEAGEAAGGEPATGIRPGMLRRVRALAELSDEQLLTFARFCRLERHAAFTRIMQVGTPGDAFYFVLEGEVRQRIPLGDRELVIGIQETGGVFGQISVFDGGPRVTDAIADTETVLLRVAAADFRRLCRLHPEIANSILLALGRTLASRIRSDDKHLCEAMEMQRRRM